MSKSQSAEVLNALAADLRADPRMPQPAEPAPAKPKRAPRVVGVEDSPTLKAARYFVTELVKLEVGRDQINTLAAMRADAFVAIAHPTKPDYGAYTEASKIIRATCALELCFAPDTIIKAYRAAVRRAFGELPVSQSPEALRNAAERAAKKTAEDAAKKAAGNDRGPVQDKAPTPHDVIGQMIATYGPAAVLVELSKILASEKATVKDAHILMDVARHYAK